MTDDEQSPAATGGSVWPAGAAFLKNQVVRLRNPDDPGGDSRFIGEAMLGMSGIVSGAEFDDGEIIYSVSLEMGGLPWALPEKFLESDGEISSVELPSVEDDFVGRRAEVLTGIPGSGISPGAVVEITGVSVSTEGRAEAFAVRAAPDGQLMMIDASDVRLL